MQREGNNNNISKSHSNRHLSQQGMIRMLVSSQMDMAMDRVRVRVRIMYKGMDKVIPMDKGTTRIRVGPRMGKII